MNARFTVNMDIKQGKFERMYYRSAGPQLTVDVLCVEFDCEGTTYTHRLPNAGWGYDVPSLQFMGYCGISPNDFEGGFFEPENDLYLPCVIKHGEGFLTNNLLKQGAEQLEKADWFNPNGSVWNGHGNSAIGGNSAEPGTGNQGAVEMEESEA